MTRLATYSKKRLDIVVEAPALARLLDLLDRLDAPGYTVTEAVAGRGRGGAWREGEISAARAMALVVCVLDESRLAAVLEAVYGLLEQRIGIVTVSDVAVVRDAHF